MKDKLDEIKALLERANDLLDQLESPVLDCPHCGTSELLCGYPNACCSGKNQ